MPFYKWLHRALKRLPILGEQISSKIDDLIGATDYEEKEKLIEEICAILIEKLRSEGLSDSSSDFLLDHGPTIQNKIANTRLRAMNAWVG